MNVLVTGGAGFIGGHIAARYLARGDRVVIFDNLSRKGTRENAVWLKQNFDRAELVEADIRTATGPLAECVRTADIVFHMASQVAVTTSIKDPRTDFEINALGTFNVLEAMRACGSKAPLLYASTNKVYGKMAEVAVAERATRYEYADLPYGISETQPLEFYSPYGCSKGAGDQYVRDYHRIYGLNTIVFRQSCIYGTRQFGIEDQGWAAWFTIAAAFDKPISIYGDGKQIRDVLYIDDLLDAYDAAIAHIGGTAGQVFNIGGGPAHTMSLRELIALLEKKLGRAIAYTCGEWRPGDQRVYVSDVRKAGAVFGWRPATSIEEGIGKLLAWALENRDVIAKIGLI